MSTKQKSFSWMWMGLILTGLGPSARAQVPPLARVAAATSKRVDLTWTGAAASYTVQRRVLGGVYTPIGTVTNSTYSDTTIDAFTTYEYQVLAGTAASTAMRVGPPPSGVTNPGPAPVKGATASETYGYNLSMVFDGNGDPAILFGWGDPNNDSEWKDSVLLFRSWNRARYEWNPLVTVATVGDVLTRFRQSVSLGYDASTNTFAAATEDETHALRLYVSTDGGATWTLKKTFTTRDSDWSSPSLALANGNIYLSAVVNTQGLHYVTGRLSADAATWTDRTAPLAPGTEIAKADTTSLALDSAGNPGIAYWADDAVDGYNEVCLFWKPASGGAPVRALDTQGRQTDDLAVKLAYFGLNPRLLVYAQRNDAEFGVRVHFARSDDAGLSWQTPVVIPPDGDSSSDFPFDLAIDSKGAAAAAFGQNSGSGGQTCGNPKLSRSSDLVHWTTCSFGDLSVTGNFTVIPGAVQLAFGGNDKLYLLWWESESAAGAAGVMMYREPPPSAVTGPVITAVVDGASFRPGIVAGSWVTIQGANLSGTTRIWGDADFNNGNLLPTNLSGVEVKMNGLPAAVYYISPTQLNVQAPAPLTGTVTVQVSYAGVSSNTMAATAVGNAPALFSYTAGGQTYPAAVYLNGQIVGDPVSGGTAVSKARPGDRILLYGTGLATSQAGTIVTAPVVVPSTVTVTVGSSPAAVEFAGLVASGEFQINIVMPNLPAGEYPVVVQVAGQSSQSGVVIPVQ
jgi:uncharacterized protein (TIGR03437 family)